jgi:hypothetical protein
MDNGLERRRAWIWAGVSLLLIAVAAIAYTLGAQHEVVQAGADTTGRVVYYRHGPWGFWWILLLFWLFGGLRWMFWGPPWAIAATTGAGTTLATNGKRGIAGSTSACRPRPRRSAATNRPTTGTRDDIRCG